MHYHNRARVFKGTNGNNVSRSRRQTRAMQLVRIRQSEFHERYGTSFITFSVFLPFIEIAARLPPLPSFFLGAAQTRRINDKAAFVYLTQFGAFSSSCAMNQDFLEYFSESNGLAILSRRTFAMEK